MIIEGGAVIKMNGNGQIDVSPGGVIDCRTDSCRPAIFTSANDNTVGETIAGSSGNPNNSENFCFLNIHAPNAVLRHVRFSHVSNAINGDNCDGSFETFVDLWNCQFVDINEVIYANDLGLHNVLISQPIGADPAIWFFGSSLVAEQVTADKGGPFIVAVNGNHPCIIALTNCLITGQSLCAADDPDNLTLWTNGSVISPPNPDSIYQTVGAGGFYLTNNSPYRDAGTTNINPTLLAELRRKTTWPPLVISNVTLAGNQAFSPQVPRDTDALDLGYHYDPIDYAVSGVTLTNARVTVEPGTVIAAFGTSNHAFGLNLGPDAKFLCKGLATNWNRVMAYNTVQEQTGTNWLRPANGLVADALGDSTSLLASRFTDWSVLAQDAPHFSISNYTAVLLRDCQFHGGSLFFDYPDQGATMIESHPVLLASDPALNNCLLERVNVVLQVADGSSCFVQNSLFRGGTFNFAPVNSAAAVQNNLFDQTVIPDNSAVSGEYLGGYNAYVTNFDRLQPFSTNDLILTGPPVYRAGPLGHYYQSADSPLLDAGSAGADQFGLYDYTVLTNLVSGQEIKETNSPVDIGYHYVALDGSGNPLATYTNGLPDYLVTSRLDELPDWWSYLFFGNLNQMADWDYDNDGTNNLEEYQNGTDPNNISFSFSVPNQYVTTSLVDGVITILGGMPSSIAVLVEGSVETNWTAYTSSNITVDIGTTPGAHDVWIGLRGRLETSYQTWEETTLVLNSIQPTIAITNPADSASFNASRVNVSGNFTAGALKQITVNGIHAFTNGASFEARNVPLAGGDNTITAIIEDLTGMTNAASIIVTGITNLDGSLSDPVQLSATPVAGFEPLTVTFSVQANAPGVLQQVLWDFNGDGVTDFTTNNPGPVAYAYTNGEYFPVVTIQTEEGRFSSIGGWNGYSLDSTNQPIRINVQKPPTLTVTLSSFEDPVDLKWDGTHLYVLSGSGAAVYEFATNSEIIRWTNNLGSNPSGFDVDGAGNVYVAVKGNNQVWKYYPTDDGFVADTNFGAGGCIGSANGTAGTGPNEFDQPYDVAVSPDGQTISVSDSGNHRIQQFSAASGAFVGSFGSYGTEVGQFKWPKGLAYDASGTLYIVDSENNRIVLAQGSAVTSATGTGGDGLGQFSGALNVSIGERGVYVADTGHGQIQKFDLPAQGLFEITSGNVGYALSAGLSSPAAVAAVDNLTNELFYVADTGHNQVLLCHLPDSNADEIMAVWNGMTNCVVQGDIAGAAQYFSTQTANDYLQDFLTIGTASLIPAINQIGTVTPASIESVTAEYYFGQNVGGQGIAFPIEFIKEDGGWKILEF